MGKKHTMLNNIHNVHMGVSYDLEHVIHKYVEYRVGSSKHFSYNKKFIITLNQFSKYDMSIHFLNSTIFPTKEEFVSNLHYFDYFNNTNNNSFKILQPSLLNSLNDSENLVMNKFDQTTKDMVCEYIKEYEKFLKCGDHFIVCLWIYSLYEQLRAMYLTENETNKVKRFVSIMYFVGLLEWFHLLVIKILYCTLFNEKKSVIMFGECLLIELDNLTNFSMSDIRTFFSCEYCSHSELYIIDCDRIMVYDPDDGSDNDIVSINRLCSFLEKEYISISLNKSIQSITDDQYCIFHCMNFLLKLLDVVSFNNTHIKSGNFIEKFMKYIESVNDMTNKSDVCTFIQDLHLKAKLCCELLDEDKSIL
jgi:hypothetical protein